MSLAISWVWWFNNIKRVGLYSLNKSIYFLNAYQFLWKNTSLLNISVIINKINHSYIPSPILVSCFSQLVTVAKQPFKHSATIFGLVPLSWPEGNGLKIIIRMQLTQKAEDIIIPFPSYHTPCFTVAMQHIYQSLLYLA